MSVSRLHRSGALKASALNIPQAKLIVGRCRHIIPVLYLAFLEQFVKKTKNSHSTRKYFEVSGLQLDGLYFDRFLQPR